MRKNKKILASLLLLGLLSSCSVIKNNNSSISSSSTSSVEPAPTDKSTTESSFKYEIVTASDGTETIKITGLKNDDYNNIILPDYINGRKVTAITTDAFKNNLNIKSLYINQFITSINGNNFLGCDNLEKIEVSPDNKSIYSRDNCVISKTTSTFNSDKVIHFYLGCKTSVIPTDIADLFLYDYAFAGVSFTKIYIPANVTNIMNQAFIKCKNLETFEVASDNPKYSCVNNCLIEAEGTSGDTTVYGIVMCGTKNSTIPTDPSIKYIDGYTFNGIDIKELYIPKNIISFKPYSSTSVCFKESGLEKITFESGSNITDASLNQLLRGLPNLKEAHLPDSVVDLSKSSNYIDDCPNLEKVYIHSKVTDVNYLSFKNDPKLKEIIIENNPYFKMENDFLTKTVSSATKYVYGYFGNDEDITIPDGVTYIGTYAFNYNNKIKKVTLPESVTTINQYAFSNSSLQEIIFNSKISTIYKYSFSNCVNLKAFNWPSTVTTIPDYVFSGAVLDSLVISNVTVNNKSLAGANIRHVEVDSNHASLACNDGLNITNKAGTELFAAFTNENGSIVVPNTVKTILQYAGYGRDMKTLIISSSVITIQGYAFYNTTNLKTAVMGDSVDGINNYAFYNSGLKSIKLSNSLKQLYGSAFASCKNLTEISLPDSLTNFSSTNIFQNCENLISVKLPSKITSIPDSTFYNCISLKNVEMPSTITSIGKNAFSYCKSLENINLPSSLKTINNSAFYNCNKLNVNLTNLTKLTSVGTYAFYLCNSLKDGYIPNSLTSLSGNIFYSSKIESINIPNSVTTIAVSAFAYTKNLKSLIIPSSVTSLSGSIINSSAVEYVEINNPTITVATSATYSSGTTFYGANNLKEIKFKGTLDQFKNVFSNSKEKFISNFNDKVFNITYLDGENYKTISSSDIAW